MSTPPLMLNGFEYIFLTMSRYEKGKEVLESIQERSVEEIFEGLEDIFFFFF